MYKRFKFSLSRKDYEDLLQRIKEDNNCLKRLTSQNLRLEPVRNPQQLRKSPNFEVIRDCAKSLFSALRSGFDCNCPESHSANLLLERRNGEHLKENKNKDEILPTLNFRITFAYGYRNSISNSVMWLWKPADVKLIDHAEDSSAGGNSNMTSGPAVTKTAKFAVSKESPKTAKVAPQKATRFAITTQADIRTNSGPSNLNPRTAPGMIHIENFCNTMVHFWPQNCPPGYTFPVLGYLLDKATKRKHCIYPLPGASFRSIPLSQVIRGSGQLTPLKVSDKKYLAVTLASNLLQLCGTPWLARQWNVNDIMFICPPNAPVFYTYPHISIPVTPSKSNPIEEERLPDASLACPNIRDPFTFGLGILLIELCLGKSIEQLRIPSDLNPDGTEHVTTNFRTATRLLDDVYQEAGGRYGDAVRRCIYCEFDQRKANLEDPSFRRAVYEGVVYWLEEDLKDFYYLV